MATWYVSQTIWTALPQWQASTTYATGDIIRPLTAFQTDNQCAYVVTTAGQSGTAEPSWNTANNGNTTDGGVTWQNVTGQQAYAWNAPAGSIGTLNANNDINARVFNNDIVFVDSTHTETSANTNTFNRAYTIAGGVKWYSVNTTTGAYTPGASVAYSGGNQIIDGGNYFYGLSISGFNVVSFLNGSVGLVYMQDGALTQANTSTQNTFAFFSNGHLVLSNMQVIPSTSAPSVFYSQYSNFIEWKNTPNALGGVSPAQFLSTNASGGVITHCKNLDLTAMTSTSCTSLFNVDVVTVGKYILENCKLGSAAIINAYPGNGTLIGQTVEIIASSTGTANNNNQRFQITGNLVTDLSTTLQGGATDGNANFSHSLQGNTFLNGQDTKATLDGFPIYFDNTSLSEITVTVELISSTTLTDADVTLQVSYFGSASNSMGETMAAALPLATPTALAVSTATWNNPPATPVAQKISVTITPAQTGLMQAIIRLAKPSTTIWYDPRVTVS